MKVDHVSKILNRMSDFEFWLFMQKPTKERMRILRRKAKKEK